MGPGGPGRGYGLSAGDETAALLQDEERPRLRIATDQVEDHIDLLSQDSLELRGVIIDDLAGSDGVEVGRIATARRGDDCGTDMGCQLDCIAAHRAGTTMDQDRLSPFQVTVGEDSLPRGLRGHRHRCRRLEGEVGWFPRDGRRLESQILRVRAHCAGTEHGIAGRIALNVAANLFDDPRELVTGYPRQGDREYLPRRS